MKKGCFLTSIVVFTLVVGVVVYLVKYKKDFFKEFSKAKIISAASGELDKKLSEVKNTVYKDSLNIQLHRFFEDNKNEKFDTAMTRMQAVIADVQYLINDKTIDSTDYQNFKTHLTRYERSKKNRN